MKGIAAVVGLVFLAAMPAAAQELKFPLPCTSQPLAGRSIFHHHPGIDKKLAAYLKAERPAWYAALLLPREGKDMTPAQIMDQALGCSFLNRELMKGMTLQDVVKMWGRPWDAAATSDLTILHWRIYEPGGVAGVEVTFRGTGPAAVVIDWTAFR